MHSSTVACCLPHCKECYLEQSQSELTAPAVSQVPQHTFANPWHRSVLTLHPYLTSASMLLLLLLLHCQTHPLGYPCRWNTGYSGYSTGYDDDPSASLREGWNKLVDKWQNWPAEERNTTLAYGAGTHARVKVLPACWLGCLVLAVCCWLDSWPPTISNAPV
jgi:hypothetical protein